MITATDILRDAFGRVHDQLGALVTGLGPEQLRWRADRDANPLGWVVWHLTRVQDDHMAALGDVPQVYEQGWVERFALPYAPTSIGYGQSSDEVGAFRIEDSGLLVGYHDAVHALSLEVLDRIPPEDYGRVVDTNFDPPVTVAVRLVSVINEIAQHTGQAAYLRGLLDRR